MKGLLLNDLLGLRRTLAYIFVFLGIYALLFTGTMGPEFISGFILVLTTMMVNSAVMIGDAAKWNMYALTMPISRRTLVQEKYLLMLLLGGGGMALSSLYTFVIYLLHHTLDLRGFFDMVLLLFSLCLFLNSVILPILLRFGSEKAKYLTIICYGVPVGGIVILGGMGVLDGWIGFLLQIRTMVALACFALSLVFMAFSYRISLWIYQKKEW